MNPLQIDPVGIIEFLFEYPELGWIPTLVYLILELRSKRGIVKGKVMEMIRANTVVVRAIARTNEDIDTEEAEKLLTDNGSKPSDFINLESEYAHRHREKEETADGSKSDDD